MTLTENLQDPKSKDLALLSAMLGTTNCQHTISDRMCTKCGQGCGPKITFACYCPDPITTDLRILAWQVKDKMVEMDLAVEFVLQLESLHDDYVTKPKNIYSSFWQWCIHICTPEDIIEAGLTVYQESKT